MCVEVSAPPTWSHSSAASYIHCFSPSTTESNTGESTVELLPKVSARLLDKRLPFYERPMNEDVEALEDEAVLVEEVAFEVAAEVVVADLVSAVVDLVPVVEGEALVGELLRLPDNMEHQDSMDLDKREYLAIVLTCLQKLKLKWLSLEVGSGQQEKTLC